MQKFLKIIHTVSSAFPIKLKFLQNFEKFFLVQENFLKCSNFESKIIFWCRNSWKLFKLFPLQIPEKYNFSKILNNLFWFRKFSKCFNFESKIIFWCRNSWKIFKLFPMQIPEKYNFSKIRKFCLWFRKIFMLLLWHHKVTD